MYLIGWEAMVEASVSVDSWGLNLKSGLEDQRFTVVRITLLK